MIEPKLGQTVGHHLRPTNRSSSPTLLLASTSSIDRHNHSSNPSHPHQVMEQNKSSIHDCHPHAPYEMLNEWHRLLFGSSIFITAIITFMLNLFVIITLVAHRYCWWKKKSNSRQNSLSTSTTTNTAVTTTTTISSSIIKSFDLPNNHKYHLDFSRSLSSASYSHTHQSFISLSISVIIYSSICVPAMYLETIEQIPSCCSNCFIIKILRFSFYAAPIASSFMHLLMAFDRYMAIKQCFSFRSYWYRRHYTFCIVLLWIISILIVVPFFWYHQFNRTMQIILTLIRLMFTFSIPSLLTLALYVSIACELGRVRKKTKITTPFIKNNKLIVKHRQIIARIIILASTHFLCWFPFSVMESLKDLFPDLFHQSDSHAQTYYSLMAILILITSMSGIAYPILYCFVSNEYQKIFRSKLSMFSFYIPRLNKCDDVRTTQQQQFKDKRQHDSNLINLVSMIDGESSHSSSSSSFKTLANMALSSGIDLFKSDQTIIDIHNEYHENQKQDFEVNKVKSEK